MKVLLSRSGIDVPPVKIFCDHSEKRMITPVITLKFVIILLNGVITV